MIGNAVFYSLKAIIDATIQSFKMIMWPLSQLYKKYEEDILEICDKLEEPFMKLDALTTYFFIDMVSVLIGIPFGLSCAKNSSRLAMALEARGIISVNTIYIIFYTLSAIELIW